MNEIEWIAYFEATNGRKPTPAELQEAVKSGIVQSSKKSFPKWVYGLVGIVAVAGVAYMFFTNTSNQEISTISTGASSSTNQTKVSQSQSSSAQKEEDGIDLSAIQAGDYASIAGLWYTEISESPKEFNWSDYFKNHQVREENGMLILSPVNLAGAPTLKIIPKGVEYNLPVEMISGGVPTMTTTDRIISEGIVSDVYYREADFKNVENTQYSISYHTQKTNGTTIWTQEQSQELADLMVSWGNSMNQSGYQDVTDTVRELSLAVVDESGAGPNYSVDFSTDGTGQAEYHIVGIYHYSKVVAGGNLDHNYLFTIKKDGTPVVLYSPTSQDNIYKVRVTDNADLTKGFEKIASNEKMIGTVGDYQQVIDDNRTMLSTKSFNGLKYYSPEALQASELYYALYDFDQNGTNEFILAGKKNDTPTGVTTFDKLASWERTIYGVFTVQDKEIITLFNGIGYRTHVAPMTDGSFWLRGSGGYDTGVYEHYSFTDSGISVSKNLMITYENLGKSTEKIQDETGKSYAWDEVKAKINQYEILSSELMEWYRL